MMTSPAQVATAIKDQLLVSDTPGKVRAMLQHTEHTARQCQRTDSEVAVSTSIITLHCGWGGA